MHSPPGWLIEKIQIEPSGQAPKHYGPGTYRFGAALTLSVILPRRGWTLVKETKNYTYLKPPEDCPGPPFHITIAVPPIKECLAIAQRSYAKEQSWMGQLGEWPALYLHNHTMDMRELSRDTITGEMIDKLIESPPE